MKYYADYKIDTKEKISSYTDIEPLENLSSECVRVGITQSEYETNIISIEKINAAILDKLNFNKDINNIDKLNKAGFLVMMDYIRLLGLTKTNTQFKTDVKTKYEEL